ncbi:MAG: DMAP1-binding domain-containing protein [Dysgonamonadaceae bacterium]|jgi:hypothetical protein|nr:DMAP1-binding domain-containing protein [Dysgonamonadaceae bacterium]
MATVKKIFEWLFYLIENTLTADTTDKIAKVNFKIRNAVIIFACLTVTMSACGQTGGNKQQSSADTTQVKVQTPQDAQKALAQLGQDFQTGKITREQYERKMKEIIAAQRNNSNYRAPANQMSPEEIQRGISEGQAAVDETMKAYDEQSGNMSWPPQDAFKRFGYYVPQPELDAPDGLRIRWELKQGKGEDGQPSESLHIEIRKKYDPAKLDDNPEKANRQVAFSDAEASAVAKFVQSCGAGRCGEGGVSPRDCNYFRKPDPQRAHVQEWQYFIATEVIGGGGTIKININTYANARAQ